jgi:hypothetical protein
MSVKRKIFQLFEQMAEEKGAGRLRLAALFLAVILPLFLSTVSEAACWEDRLDRVDRDILVTTSGAVYRVLPRDTMTSAFWVPFTDVIICDSTVDAGG